MSSEDYFFDNYRLAEFYESIYGPIKADFPFWKKVSEKAETILELACGTGRVTLELAKSGKQIYALDYSREMLQILNSKIEKQKIGNIRTILGDMRDFSFDRQFDTILITSNSLNHIETIPDLRKCFEVILKHLKPGGVLAFDILNPEPRFLLRNQEETYDHTVFTPASGDKKFKMWENSLYDKAAQINHVNYFYQYVDEKEQGVGEITKTNIKVRLFYPQEMDMFLELLGLKFEKYDWYEMSPWQGKRSEQLYVIKKP